MQARECSPSVEIVMKRRGLLKWLAVAGSLFATAWQADAQAPLKEICIGYPKTGVPVIPRQQGILGKKFSRAGDGGERVRFFVGPADEGGEEPGDGRSRPGRRPPADLRAGGER